MRVVLHAHSTWSYDGRWSLDRIARVFGWLGIDAVMMTEHDTSFDPESFEAYRMECAAASTPRCRLIPGIEYSSPDNAVHILTWGLPHFLAEHRPVMETLQRVREAGGAAVLAHPARREAWRIFDPEWVPFLSGIELWNRKADGLCSGQEAARLIAETGLPATVGIDFHGPKQIYPLINRIELPSGVTIESGLVAAVREGRQAPEALWQSVLPGDANKASIHTALEHLRRRALTLRRRRR